MWDGYLFANPDGDDYEPLGKYYMYRLLLRIIRQNDSISEEVKLRRINRLKEVVFPLWHRGEEIHKREKAELKAVFLKYNGPEGPRTSYGQECDEVRAQIAASDDAVMLEDMDLAPVYDGASGYRAFTYEKKGAIVYQGMDMGHEKEEKESSSELPVINLVPLGADDCIPHHHNKNPDDDLSLNPTLLQLLHRLMDDQLAAPFINLDDEKRGPKHYFLVKRPRWFKFIEQGLTSDPSLGYGATAFFNDMLLLFRNPARWTIKSIDWDTERAIMLETEMKMMLQKMGSVGEQFLALYAAIAEQGPEPWGDPEIPYFQEPHHPRLPGYNGTKPDLKAIKAAAWDQLKLGQQRVQQLRSRLASTVSNTGQSDPTSALAGGAPLNHEPGKQPHEESAEPTKDDLNHEPKSQQSIGSASTRPSDPDTAPPGPAAAKRPRAPADNDGDARDEEAEEGRATKRPKLLPENTTASSSTTAMSSGAVASGSHTAAPQGSASKRARTPADNDGDVGDEEVEEGRATKRPKLRLNMSTASSSTTAMSSAAVASSSRADIPEQPASKRARTPADVDGDGDDQGDGAVGEPSRSKRHRLTKDTHPVGIPVASPEAGPSTASKASGEPANPVSGSSQAHASSAAGQPAPQPQVPGHYETPSSQSLDFSRSTIDMATVVRKAKARPWLFGYSTDQGYGIYAFTKCPGQDCKHRFSSHPLKDNRARDHFLSCNQPMLDEKDMVRQYASQVVKTAGRKSDLTVDWARKSNLTLLPSNQKDNHPDNFPLSPANE